MKKQKLLTPSNGLAALFLTLFLISGAVILTLNFRPLFYFDISFLNIPAQSGLSEADIRLNYDTLISYNSIFMSGALKFPTLPMSESGRIHFEEVKNIFSAVQILFAVSFLGTVAAFILKLKKKNTAFLKLSALFSVGIPTLLGVLIAANWEAFFIGFHKIFFRNDYWLFSAETDPVITILPDTFFMHCAIMILGLIILGSLIFFLLNKLLAKNIDS